MTFKETVTTIWNWIVEKAKAFYAYCGEHPRFTNGLIGFTVGFGAGYYLGVN